MIEALNKEIKFGRIDLAGEKANFIMAQEYYDWIEFLQNELGFERVEGLQKKFGGSFCNFDEVKPKEI